MGAFFQIKAFQAPFLPRFPPNLLKFPQLARKRYNKNMTSQKSMHFEFRRHFCEIKAHTAILRRFSHILPKFPQIFPGFSPNQKFWGTLAPRAPPCTTRTPLHHAHPRLLHQCLLLRVKEYSLAITFLMCVV